MIDGVKVVPLRQIVDERGKIMHMLKATDPHFLGFGEIYFSTRMARDSQGVARAHDDDGQQRRHRRTSQAGHV